jgi:hypothetical protein
MSKEVSVNNGGVGVLGLLGVVFVTLKLLGIAPVAAWSWWWVTAPFWGGLALLIVVALVGLAIIAMMAGVLALLEKRRK